MLRSAGWSVDVNGTGALTVQGATPEEVGRAAQLHGVALTELGAVSRSLEDAFLTLTKASA